MSCLPCDYKNCKPYANSLQDDPTSLCPCACHGQGEVEREPSCGQCGSENCAGTCIEEEIEAQDNAE